MPRGNARPHQEDSCAGFQLIVEGIVGPEHVGRDDEAQATVLAKGRGLCRRLIRHQGGAWSSVDVGVQPISDLAFRV